ncbi:MAG: hypothetical protein UU09_C0007G0002 [Microgenomates group bacterium GW2011_GWA2_40_6]|nr:MAG: hypothetical protein UU09_C0007G0002 [Microgenomates group bacterium GW2011_GWA2_40_6]
MPEKQLSKISPRALEINKLLEEAGPPEISIYPEVFTRRKTPIEIEREEEAERRAKYGN